MRRLCWAVLATLACGACNTTGKNPFQPQGHFAPVPASARLIFSSSAYTTRAGAPRDVFSVRADGTELTRLTFCNVEGSACDFAAAAPSPDRLRLALLRIQTDGNGDGRLAPPDDADLMIADLSHSILAPLVPAAVGATSVDWSSQDFLVFSARGTAPNEMDLFRVLPTSGQAPAVVTAAATLADRALRLDVSGQFGVFERTTIGAQTTVFAILNALTQITSGGDGSAALAGTPYLVGSDASPAFSPDDREVVFRRLIGTSPAGLGSWEVRVNTIASHAERALTTGALWRGAPDWGPEGVAFPETENNQTRLVLMDSDGANRRVLITLPVGQTLDSVRWLPVL
jgi:hypothetical protein